MPWASCSTTHAVHLFDGLCALVVLDTWPYIVDILRNEKPVYFAFNDSIQSGSLHTGWEPTGEEE
jgi:hypothetical protein